MAELAFDEELSKAEEEEEEEEEAEKPKEQAVPSLLGVMK